MNLLSVRSRYRPTFIAAMHLVRPLSVTWEGEQEGGGGWEKGMTIVISVSEFCRIVYLLLLQITH